MKRLLTIATVLLLGACGFHLKGTQDYDHLPYRSWHISGQNLQQVLETAIRRADGLPTSAGNAQATLQVIDIQEEKDVLVITRAAMINEYQLTFRVRVQASSQGKNLGEPFTVEVKRVLEYADSQILGKQEEEKLIWQEMREEAAQQIVRRLAFLPR